MVSTVLKNLRELENLEFAPIMGYMQEAGQPADMRRPEVDYIGPFEHHKVVVDGWQVPLVSATPKAGGNVELILDDRFALDLSLADAERVVPFVAHAISVALGFASHPTEDSSPVRISGPRRLRRLDSSEAEEPHGSALDD